MHENWQDEGGGGEEEELAKGGFINKILLLRGHLTMID